MIKMTEHMKRKLKMYTLSRLLSLWPRFYHKINSGSTDLSAIMCFSFFNSFSFLLFSSSLSLTYYPFLVSRMSSAWSMRIFHYLRLFSNSVIFSSSLSHLFLHQAKRLKESYTIGLKSKSTTSLVCIDLKVI